MSLSGALTEWTNTIERLDWGVQHVLFDALKLVASEDIHMAYAADVSDGTPCLLNAVSALTEQTKNNLVRTPNTFAPAVVTAFDHVNRELFNVDVNEDPHRVSPLAAEVLLRHFGELKKANPTPPVVSKDNVTVTEPYIEPTDTELAEQWINVITSDTTPPPSVEIETDTSIIEATKSIIKANDAQTYDAQTS